MEKTKCNSGAWCLICGKQNVQYSILKGSFTYACLTKDCNATGTGYGFSGMKPRAYIAYSKI